ncbi:hypothetical protein [Novosphingobium sp. B 225]|uniref:hypothetical protein n=1 Tax=Novosphingobium sp. B 225 TaxID=1961849 RepID=UPI000B4A63C3|nr:hypothetical protein [Novosphingobium sp. B 225]
MSFIERRRPGFTADLMLRVALVWLIICAIFVATKWAAIRGMVLPDPDDTLRMVQVRDLIAGQGWWDLHQYRVAPPQGMLMHWSRLVDAPLWALQLALRPLLGPALAEQTAMVVVPLLTLGAAMLLAARLAWRVADMQLIYYTAVLLALSSPVTAQVQPLRIDHHGWQIVAVLAAMNALTARTSRKAGWLAGLALALGLTISLELLPIAALFAAVLVLRALYDPAERMAPAAFLQALALAGLGAFLLTHGLTDLAQHCDAVSPGWLGALVVAAMGTSAIAALPRVPRFGLLLAYGGVGALSLAMLLALAPECARGPFAALDPLVRTFWYSNVFEGMPIWYQKSHSMVQMLFPPLLGLWAALRLRGQSAGWMRRFWGEYALILAGLIVLSVMVARSAAFAGAVGVVPLAWQVREWHRRVHRFKSPLGRIGGVLGLAMLVMPGVPLLALNKLTAPKPAPLVDLGAQQICDLPAAAPALARLPAGTVFTQIDLGPQLLAFTAHRVVATAHHRAPAAMHDLIAASIQSADQARPLLARYDARYVLVCPGLIEVGNYRRNAPQGFVPQLAEGKAPVWLKPLPLPKESGLMLWEVTRP